MWLYLICKHCPIENVSGITCRKAVVFPVIYQWTQAVKFSGITTGKTVDSRFQLITVVIPPNFTTGIPLETNDYNTDIPLVYH